MRWMLVLALVAATAGAHAEVYRWVDDDGVVHFSDGPPRDGDVGRDAVDEIVIPEVNSAKSVEVEPTTPDRDAAAGGGDEVVMYSASWCGVCDRARAYFERNEVPYREYDVEESTKGRKDFAAMGAKGVPVILVGDQRMIGFSPARFDRIYSP